MYIRDRNGAVLSVPELQRFLAQSPPPLYREASAILRRAAQSGQRLLATATPAGAALCEDDETLRELVDVALEKMQAFASSGPTEDALDKARRYLAGLFPMGLESHEALAEQIADALLDGIGLDHLAKYRSRVLAVTVEQARSIAKDLSPARPGAQLVVVGEADVCRRALKGFCPVEVRQLEEFA